MILKYGYESVDYWFAFVTCVMASGEVISCIFFARYELFRMEELSVASISDFINDSGF